MFNKSKKIKGKESLGNTVKAILTVYTISQAPISLVVLDSVQHYFTIT